MSDLYRITKLDNGLRVVSELMPRLETAALGVWVDVGTRYEPAEVNGVAHLLEHMAFKGTRTRSARAIAEEIERVGGSLNAYTSREHTAYYARILGSDVALAADIIADILQRSTFDPAELEKERHVVLQEIGQVRDTPDDLVFDLLQEAAYPDQPMGRSILGPEAIVATMPREALIDYMARHYGPARMVLSAAGKVDHDHLVELASRLFRDLPATAGTPAPAARYQGGSRIERRPDLEQVHVCLGLEGVAYHDPDHFALQVLSTALGGGMSSRLFQEAREERGLCYSIFSFASAYADTGTLGVYAGTDPEDVEELLAVVADETRSLIEEPREDELVRARAQLKASLFMGLESCSAVCEDNARQLLCFGRRIPSEEIVARIDAVDTDAIRRLGRRLLAGKGLTLAAVGPLEALPPVDLTPLAV
ncbi:M16 family metallopeptidase [Benzoatithermus flavus]|uniref:Pitrilysin family protein n=1 Tax=Benzoatithermus flavus TaxID=3108223 RepID=A0ABU8XU44_9PROT